MFVNGGSWGLTPVSRPVPEGIYTIQFAAVNGFGIPPLQTITMHSHQPQAVQATYVRQGTLTVDTSPIAADIFVDGQSWGRSPQTRTVDVGSHTVVFAAVDGFLLPSAQHPNVAANAVTHITGAYAEIQLGTLTIDSQPVRGDVFVNGERWGPAPQSRVVSTGKYTVTFSGIDGFATPGSSFVTVGKDQTASFMAHYEAARGTLTIDTTPKTDIRVNGESWGTSPQARDMLPGDYTVEFAPVAGYEAPAAWHVSVSANITTPVNVALRALTPDVQPVAAEESAPRASGGTACGTLGAGALVSGLTLIGLVGWHRMRRRR